MKRAIRVSAFLLGAALLAGQSFGTLADCCPRLDSAGPDVAAAGCCGHCPTTLAPTQEPASLNAKSAPVQAPMLAGLSVALFAAEALEMLSRTAAPAGSPPSLAPRAAPLRL